MKKFVNPEIEVLLFNSEDVILTDSYTESGDGDVEKGYDEI